MSMRKYAPDDESDYDTDQPPAGAETPDPYRHEYSQSSRPPSRSSPSERDPGSSSGGGQSAMQSPRGPYAQPVVPPEPGSSSDFALEEMAVGPRYDRYKQGASKILEQVGMAVEETRGSDSANVHVLIAFRAHVDVLAAHGAFENDGTKLGKKFAALGDKDASFYDKLTSAINAHIEMERAKERDPTEYVRAKKPMPCMFFDPETMSNGIPDLKVQLERFAEQQKKNMIGVAFAHREAAETAAKSFVDSFQDARALQTALLDQEGGYGQRLYSEYNEIIAPEYAGIAGDCVAMAKEVQAKLPIPQYKGRDPDLSMLDVDLHVDDLLLEEPVGRLSPPTLDRKRSNPTPEPGDQGKRASSYSPTPPPTVEQPKRSPSHSDPKTTPPLRFEAAAGDSTDWRSLFPDSVATGMPARTRSQTRNAIPNTYAQRQERLQELKGIYGDNLSQQLNIDINVRFADIPTFSRADFRTQLGHVLRYYLHWYRGHPVQAVLSIVPFITFAFYGAGPSLAAAAVVDVVALARRKFEQHFDNVSSAEFDQFTNDIREMNSRARPFLILAGFLGLSTLTGMSGYVLGPAKDAAEQALLLFYAWRQARVPGRRTVMQAFLDGTGVARQPVGPPDQVLDAVREWRGLPGNGVTEPLVWGEEQGRRRLGRDNPHHRLLQNGPWGANEARAIVDAIYKGGQQLSRLQGGVIHLARVVSQMALLHAYQVRPDRARVYLYELDPTMPVDAQGRPRPGDNPRRLSIDNTRLILNACQLMYDKDSARGQVQQTNWFPQVPDPRPDLPDWYKFPVEQDFGVAPALKRRHFWFTHQLAMLKETTDRWEAPYNGENWVTASWETLMSWTDDVYDGTVVLRHIRNDPVISDKLQIDDNTLPQLKVYYENHEGWETLFRTFQKELRKMVTIRQGPNIRKEPDWLATDDRAIPRPAKISQYWWMLVHAMEGYIYKMQGKMLENRLDGDPGDTFSNRGQLSINDLKTSVTEMEELFDRAKRELKPLDDLGQKQVHLEGFRTVDNGKTILEDAFARFYPTYMDDKRQEAQEEDDDDGEGGDEGGVGAPGRAGGRAGGRARGGGRGRGRGRGRQQQQGGAGVVVNNDELAGFPGFGPVPGQGGGTDADDGADDGAGVGMGASVVDEVFARLHRLRL